jgi:hypothetical protein
MSSLLLLQVFTVPSYVFTVQTAKRLCLGAFSGTVEFAAGDCPAARAAAGTDPVPLAWPVRVRMHLVAPLDCSSQGRCVPCGRCRWHAA